MTLYSSGTSSKARQIPQGKSEFELLKGSHKFLRDGEDDEDHLSWEDKLASKYYSSLYREFAVCDLKHYKSGNFALRWRTEDEVLTGTGESMCGNTRCKYYNGRGPERKKPTLSTLELPFAYREHEENKSALVKVVLCARCVDKLTWKRRQGSKEEGEKPDQELGHSGIEGEELNLDVLNGEGINRGNRESSESHRIEESNRRRNARVNRWDGEDRGRERETDRYKTRSPRSRSPEPQVVRKRSRHK